VCIGQGCHGCPARSQCIREPCPLTLPQGSCEHNRRCACRKTHNCEGQGSISYPTLPAQGEISTRKQHKSPPTLPLSPSPQAIVRKDGARAEPGVLEAAVDEGSVLVNDGDLAVTSLSLKFAVTVLRAQPAAARAVCDKVGLRRAKHLLPAGQAGEAAGAVWCGAARWGCGKHFDNGMTPVWLSH
jgi:hypothetical protein